MKLLFDTCAVLWIAADRSRISEKARAAIVEHSDQLFVSAISAFEIGLKQRKGKLSLADDAERWWPDFLATFSVVAIPVSDIIAIASTKLPFLHQDPSDRIIIATAAIEGMSIITSDHLIRQYPDANVIWY